MTSQIRHMSRRAMFTGTRVNSERPAVITHDMDRYADADKQDSEWVEFATCAGADDETFFPGNGRTRAAREFCTVCPVMAECLAYALERPWLTGVWGGVSAHERRDMRRAASKASA